MVIIGISGVNVKENDESHWDNLEIALKEQLPHAKFVVERELNCRPYSFSRLRQLAYRIALKHDTGEEIVLLGKSAGGIVALIVASLLKNSRVLLIATLFAPHQFPLWGAYRWLLGAPRDPGVPIITFQMVGDRLVWWGARHPLSKSHVVLRSNVRHAHKYALVNDLELARVVARHVKEALFPSA
ncbi:MAG TPA: hypothetical protein VNM40_00795 [Candidatus Paceibacterota bacterium]|nr:hypothetical protein [Candidatus Paceibacterota bacterium]